MPDKPALSEAKRALLEKYLQGEIAQNVASSEIASKPSETIELNQRERILAVQRRGTRKPFFYLHGDWDGNAYYAYPLARDLGPDQPFYVVEPYRFDDLPAPPSFEEIAAAHVKSIRSIQPEGPYLLGGWCNGGLFAYEIALQLLAADQKVDLLVLMDADYPAYAYPATMRWARSVISFIGNGLKIGEDKQLNNFLRYRHLRLLFHFWRVKDSEKLRGVLEVGRRCKDARVWPLSKLSWLFPTAASLRGEWPSVYEWISLAYKPALYPGKVTFFWDEVETWRRNGWLSFEASKGDEVEIHILQGSHRGCRSEHLPDLAKRLRACLRKVQIASLSQ